MMLTRSVLMQQYPTIDDLIPMAHRRVPQFAQDYLEHGAGRETLLTRNQSAFDDIQITPRYMRDISSIDTSKSLFNRKYDLPFGIGPVGLGGLIWPRSENYTAAAAAEFNIPISLSTVASTTIETMAEQTNGQMWFQLYSPKSESIRFDLINRAIAAGVEVLTVTVDVPSPARRERTLRSGLSLVPKITARNIAQAAQNPNWSLQTLRYGIAEFKMFHKYMEDGQSLAERMKFVTDQVGRQILPDELAQIRDRWPGKLVVKGVLHPDDAKYLNSVGVDGVIVSNHGGRQSDASPTTISMLPQIRSVAGDMAVMLDSGVRSGLDVFRALTLGADFVFLGRPFFYGAAALGAEGPSHVAKVLQEELSQTMRQMGVVSIDDSRNLREWAKAGGH
ncbi:alpha-hydroxy acid oxidase [Sulfitobacter sp. AS92]|uniref:alpha-hydroxy acid oxidase n=1 Tax=Sulfitobacter sp. AS92 TaxID=3135783 RepID=UPI0031704955